MDRIILSRKVRVFYIIFSFLTLILFISSYIHNSQLESIDIYKNSPLVDIEIISFSLLLFFYFINAIVIYMRNKEKNSLLLMRIISIILFTMLILAVYIDRSTLIYIT